MSTNVTIAETFPLVGNRPHRNEAMITDSHHHHHVLLRTIENVIAIMTGDLLPLPVRRGCTSRPLPTREITHPPRHTIGVAHHHLWVLVMSIRQEREKVRTEYITRLRNYLLFCCIGLQSEFPQMLMHAHIYTCTLVIIYLLQGQSPIMMLQLAEGLERPWRQQSG
jgi:hypothetical protein